MPESKRSIDQFRKWEIPKKQTYYYKGKGTARFQVNGVLFHQKAAKTAVNILSNWYSPSTDVEQPKLLGNFLEKLGKPFKKWTA